MSKNEVLRLLYSKSNCGLTYTEFIEKEIYLERKLADTLNEKEKQEYAKYFRC